MDLSKLSYNASAILRLSMFYVLFFLMIGAMWGVYQNVDINIKPGLRFYIIVASVLLLPDMIECLIGHTKKLFGRQQYTEE